MNNEAECDKIGYEIVHAIDFFFIKTFALH